MIGERIVRIGGGSGFWGDSRVGPDQLADQPQLDYIIFDYLAELTMALLAGARRKSPDLGYATDFVEVVRDILPRCLRHGIRLIANAGGLNPASCAAAIGQVAAELGLKVQVATVIGDDVLDRVPAMRAAGVRDFYTSEPLPQRLLSANAYLGALPIKAALDCGADIVVTGRVADSALPLGALMHEFGWGENEHDRLAAGSLAGHLIECGAQGAGGLLTDWRSVPDWPNIGYPIVECASDGSFVLTKPDGTGGLVTPAVAAEQMLYEIGDPASYILPDVICDFTNVTLAPQGPDRVRVSGARGRPPTDTYKVAGTYQDGFRTVATLTIVGFEAAAKARRTGEALLDRVSRMLARQQMVGFTDAMIEVFGGDAPEDGIGEAVLRVAAAHPDRRALEMLAAEVAPSGTSWSVGTVGSIIPGRPRVSPMVRLATFLLSKEAIVPVISLKGEETAIDVPRGRKQERLVQSAEPSPLPAPRSEAHAEVSVPLIRIAHGRSGDKGIDCNVGIVTRDPALYPVLLEQLTASAIRAHLGDLVCGDIERFELPGTHALNFLLRDALGGGGMRSMRSDPLGKSMAQRVLAMKIQVPQALLER
jgi:hypothetical protein